MITQIEEILESMRDDSYFKDEAVILKTYIERLKYDSDNRDVRIKELELENENTHRSLSYMTLLSVQQIKKIAKLEEFKCETLRFLTDLRADCPQEWEELDRVIQIAEEY